MLRSAKLQKRLLKTMRDKIWQTTNEQMNDEMQNETQN